MFFSFSPFISCLCHFTNGTDSGQRLGNDQKDNKGKSFANRQKA